MDHKVSDAISSARNIDFKEIHEITFLELNSDGASSFLMKIRVRKTNGCRVVE